MRDLGSQALFPQALLHDLRNFYTISRDFLRDFYAIFCQAQNVLSQAPKTIMQA